MKKVSRYAALSVMALFVLASLAVVLATQLIEIDDYRATVVQALSEQVRLDVEIQDTLEWVPGLRPTVLARNLEFYNPDRDMWPEAIARLGRLTLMADIVASAQSNTLVLTRAGIEDVQLRLIRTADGDANWRTAADEIQPSEEEGGVKPALQLERVDVLDLTLDYERRPSSPDLTLSLHQLQLIATSMAPPRGISLLAKGLYEEEEFELTGNVEWDDDQPILASEGEHRLTLQGRLAETTLRLEGSLRDPRVDAAADLQLNVTSPSIALLARRFGFDRLLDFTDLGAAEAKARLQGRGGSIMLNPVEITIGEGPGERVQIRGSVDDLVADRRIDAQIDLETHDVGRWAQRFRLPAPVLGSGRASAHLLVVPERLELDSIQLSSVHRDGARVQLEGKLVRTEKTWSGDVGVRIEGASAAQALELVDDTLRRVTGEERPAATLPGGRPLSPSDRALLRIGPATTSVRIVEEGGGWALRKASLLAGLEGTEWVRVSGHIDRIIPKLAGIELELTAGSNDLQALGERIDIEVPQLDRLRASGTLLGDPADLMLNELQLTLAHEDLVRIAVNGDVALLEDLSKTELELSVNARTLAALGAVFDRPLWQAGPVELSARVRGQPNHLIAKAMRLRLGESRARGDLQLRRHDDRGRLSAQLQSSHLRLRDFGFDPKPMDEDDVSEEPIEDSNLWNELLPVRGLGDMDVDLALRADRVTGRGGLDVHDVSFDGSLAAGLVRVGDLQMAWDGGRAHAIAQIDGRVSPPTALLQARIERAQVAQLIAQLTREDLGDGYADLWINATSEGATLAAMLAHISGSLVFYGREGTVPRKYSRALQLDTVPKAFRKDPDSDMEQVNCLIADLEAKNGRAQFESLLLDTPEQQVLVSGDIDFARKNLDVVLTPALKEMIPGSVTVPIHLHGSFDDPVVVPAPLATAGAAAQAIVKRSLEPIRRFLPGVGEAIDDARRTTERTLASASGSSESSLWMPGVDVTCQNFLAQERIARALGNQPRDLEAVTD